MQHHNNKPGMTLILARNPASFDWILSPMTSIAYDPGPIKTIFSDSNAAAKSYVNRCLFFFVVGFFSLHYDAPDKLYKTQINRINVCLIFFSQTHTKFFFVLEKQNILSKKNTYKNTFKEFFFLHYFLIKIQIQDEQLVPLSFYMLQ